MSLPPSTAMLREDRESGLDALRGLAALSVVVLHILTLFLGTKYPEYRWFDRVMPLLSRTPLSLLWSGQQAVKLFFVLSGFALYRMLDGRKISARVYFVRRIFRLWPPYAFAIGCALVSISIFGTAKFDRLGAWQNIFLGNSVTSLDVLLHLTMVANFNVAKLDPVVWSLVHEMRMSLVFPIVYLLLRKFDSVAIVTASLAVAIAVFFYLRWTATTPDTVGLWNTLTQQIYFVAGAAIAHSAMPVRRFYCRLPDVPRWSIFLVALILYADCLPLVGHAGFIDLSAWTPLHQVGQMGILLGAVWIVIATISSPRLKGLLNTPLLGELGRISYSLYLLHYIVLLGAINALGRSWTPFEIALLAGPLAFVAAYAANRLVEEPSNRFGRRLAEQPHPAPLGRRAI